MTKEEILKELEKPFEEKSEVSVIFEDRVAIKSAKIVRYLGYHKMAEVVSDEIDEDITWNYDLEEIQLINKEKESDKN